MKRKLPELLILVRLNEGHLSPEETNRWRERIGADVALRRRWMRVRQAYQWLPTAARMNGFDALPVGEPDTDPAEPPSRRPAAESPELIAAFVEGRLTDDEKDRFEARCWRSPQLLVEVIDTYRFGARSLQPAPADDALAQRLLAMGSQLDESTPTPPVPTVAPLVESTLSREPGPPPLADAIELPPAVDRPASGGMRRSRRRFRPLRLMVAALIAVVSVLGAVLLIIGLSRPDGMAGNRPGGVKPAPGGLNSERPDGLTDESPDGVLRPPNENPSAPDESADEGPIDAEAIPEGDFPRFPLDSAIGVAPDNRDAVPAVGPDELDLDTGDSTANGQADAVVESTTAPVDLQWERVEGLLAVRDEISGTWMGIAHRSSKDQNGVFATLSQSWASAHVAEWGELTLDKDSEASLHQALSHPDEYLLQLRHGRVAFKEMPAGTVLRIQLPQSWWQVEIVEEASQFAVERIGAAFAVVVRRGHVRVEGSDVARGERYVSTDPSAVASPYEGETQWFDRPTETSGVPRRTLDALNASGDLLTDLRTLQESSSPTVRRAAVQWTMAMFPAESVYETLHAENEWVRRDAFLWLIDGDIRQERVRRAWAVLARRTGDPPAVRSIVNWASLARRGETLTLEEARNMLAALDHDEYVFRFAGAYFLELAFGNPFRYQPAGERADRNRAATQWGQAIRRMYQSRTRTGTTRPGNSNR